MNLLMMAPLLDSRGNLRYFIGAQVDVSGLVKDATDLDAFQQYLAVHEGDEVEEPKDEFQELSKMFNHAELETVRVHGGKMHREHLEEQDDNQSLHHSRPRVLIKDMMDFEGDNNNNNNNNNNRVPTPVSTATNGKLAGVYKHVSLPPSLISITDLMTVPPNTACAVPPHPFRIPVPPRPRYSAIPLPRPNRRFHARSRLPCRSPR
jgi:hypothetical protein